MSQKLSETDDGKYYLALGQFINSFATTESLLYITLDEQSGQSPPVRRVLTGPIMLTAVIDRLTGLMDLGIGSLDEGSRTEIKGAFTQLRLIADMRNRLIHQGGNMIATGELFVRAKHPPKPGASIADELYDPRVLHEMLMDLQTIRYKVLYWYSNDRSNPFYHGAYLNSRRPWQFKPRPPKRPGQKIRPKR